MNNRIYSISEIKEMIADIAAKYDVDKIYLFGSYAKNKATAKSDIDLYLEGYVYHKFLNLANMYEDIENRFSKSVDIITEEDIQLNCESAQKLYNNIIEESVILYAR